MIKDNKLTTKIVQSMIYKVRNQKIMLDFELAKIYGYETKRFNEQVKNNIDRFDSSFRFQLTIEEWSKILKSKKTSSSWGGRRTLPFAFTETGIYMLMTVLKGDLAIKQSKMLIKTFKLMKDYIVKNKEILITETENIKLSDIVIDFKTISESIFHCGSSSKDAGNKITTIVRIEDKNIYKTLIEDILNNKLLLLEK